MQNASSAGAPRCCSRPLVGAGLGGRAGRTHHVAPAPTGPTPLQALTADVADEEARTGSVARESTVVESRTASAAETARASKAERRGGSADVHSTSLTRVRDGAAGRSQWAGGVVERASSVLPAIRGRRLGTVEQAATASASEATCTSSGAPQGASHGSARPPCAGESRAPNLQATRRPSLLTDLQDPRRANGACRHNFDDAQGSRPGLRSPSPPSWVWAATRGVVAAHGAQRRMG